MAGRSWLSALPESYVVLPTSLVDYFRAFRYRTDEYACMKRAEAAGFHNLGGYGATAEKLYY